jgi:erythronate-4-phosphate dehydrogenase
LGNRGLPAAFFVIRTPLYYAQFLLNTVSYHSLILFIPRQCSKKTTKLKKQKMIRPKIIADDKIPFLKGVLEQFADITYLPGGRTLQDDVKDADVIITRTRTLCNETLLKGSSVKLITTATIGYDHIDTDYCDKAGIRWINAPGCNSWSVQQYITAAIITLVHERNLKIQNLTIGIIGVGNVGSKVAAAAEALGMKVLLNDPPRKQRENNNDFIELDELLAKSNIVTCHVPLEKEGPYPAYHLADETFFGKMKDGAVFINTSRGPVTDTKALKKAVNTKLSSYILDVWEGEPNIDLDLLDGAFIGTPHIAGYSNDGKANGTAACVREIACFFGIEALKNWYPDAVPAPPMDTEILPDGNGKSREQIIYEVVTHTYPIWEDSERLKQSPHTFESQRGNYRIRREFKNFSINARNVDNEILSTLKKIGFKINA